MLADARPAAARPRGPFPDACGRTFPPPPAPGPFPNRGCPSPSPPAHGVLSRCPRTHVPASARPWGPFPMPADARPAATRPRALSPFPMPADHASMPQPTPGALCRCLDVPPHRRPTPGPFPDACGCPRGRTPKPPGRMPKPPGGTAARPQTSGKGPGVGIGGDTHPPRGRGFCFS
jgi:hypothetical protein